MTYPERLERLADGIDVAGVDARWLSDTAARLPQAHAIYGLRVIGRVVELLEELAVMATEMMNETAIEMMNTTAIEPTDEPELATDNGRPARLRGQV